MRLCLLLAICAVALAADLRLTGAQLFRVGGYRYVHFLPSVGGPKPTQVTVTVNGAAQSVGPLAFDGKGAPKVRNAGFKWYWKSGDCPGTGGTGCPLYQDSGSPELAAADKIVITLK